MSIFPVTAHPHVLHAAMETAAITSAAWYYRYLRRKAGAGSLLGDGGFAVLLGCILGAALGNKIVFWLEVPDLFATYWNRPEVWISGQSMVGGLLGGLIGVEIAKRTAGVRRSTGDAFVFPVLLGLSIGRVGCFLAGLDDGTYGLPTDLPWGVDFGDGLSRHPTQLYEILFVVVAWGLLYWVAPALADRPGLLFKLMLCSYLFWRLLIDFLKPAPVVWFASMSGIQVVCLMALVVYAPLTVRQWKGLST